MEETPDKTKETNADDAKDDDKGAELTKEVAVKNTAVEESAVEKPSAVVETRVERARVSTTQKPRRTTVKVVIVVAVVAVAATALVLWLFTRERGDAGRVVTAPRTVTLEQANADGAAAAPGEATLTISPDAAARAGIKVDA